MFLSAVGNKETIRCKKQKKQKQRKKTEERKKTWGLTITLTPRHGRIFWGENKEKGVCVCECVCLSVSEHKEGNLLDTGL